MPLRRASAIARLFKRHLKLADNGAYVWNYWWGPIEQGWTRENSPSVNTPTYAGSTHVEDTSHGCLEVQFAARCAEAGVVFDAEDMHRFAATFLLNVADPRELTMNDRVDGGGKTGQHDAMVGYWMELAKWEPRVASVALEIAEKQALRDKAYGSPMLSLARAIKWSLPSAASAAADPRVRAKTGVVMLPWPRTARSMFVGYRATSRRSCTMDAAPSGLHRIPARFEPRLDDTLAGGFGYSAADVQALGQGYLVSNSQTRGSPI